jgi:hypothetical protein
MGFEIMSSMGILASFLENGYIGSGNMGSGKEI